VLAIVLGAVVLAASGAGSAGGAKTKALPSGSSPLAGSSFQGGDGNQADEAPYIDWQALETAGRVVHSPDPNDADSAFKGGTKEDDPGGWEFTTEAGGVTPGKANIRDAFSAVDQPNGNTFVYLGFTRESAEGTTYVAFELNQDPRLWNNGHAEIPCRRDGDVLVVMAAQGNSIDMTVEQWTTTATDPGTGCATHGTLTPYANIPAADAQGAVNTGSITSHLPGTHQPGTTIGAGLFAEASLNLSALLDHAFSDRCLNFGSIWMHSRSSLSASSNMQDYVAPHGLVVRTCAASGTKFLDLNANGHRDHGEPGIPRFLIWADYNDNGILDANEPYTVTDEHGHYVLNNIEPPDGRYWLRETLMNPQGDATAWRCSFPNAGTHGGFGDGPGGLFGCGWGPIDTAQTPYARHRDFGDWLPAQLTVEKQLFPATDPGRFDLIVNGEIVVPSAGDGATKTIWVPPGSYDVSEAAVPPADPSAYTSTVSCATAPRRRHARRHGRASATVTLAAAEHVTCTFVNVLNTTPGTPAIAIEKTGPETATAGDTLHFTMHVTNPGEVPIPASTVHVSDPNCDAPPHLVDKAGPNGPDTSPHTLDPGDTWTYTCSHATSAPSADCVLSTVTNTASASGIIGDITVSDDSSWDTTLECPDQPPEPPLPKPEPPDPLPPFPDPNPGPTPPIVVPPGPTPPPAGEEDLAGLHIRRGCVSHVSQISLTGRDIQVIRVEVDGRIISRQTLAILQQTTTPLRHIVRPGRHRITIRVTFQRGAGGPPVTLTRAFTVCGVRARFTG
jgi:hypothetical protein